MRAVRAQLQRSARSSRQVKLVEASVKGPTVLRNAGFYGGVVAAYVFTEKMAGGIRGVYDSWNAVPAALAAGVGIGIRAGSVPVAAGMTGGILGLKYVLQGSGAEVQPKDAGAYYYYGDGETGRERWLAKNAEERATWLKAPFVRFHSPRIYLDRFQRFSAISRPSFPAVFPIISVLTPRFQKTKVQGLKRRKKDWRARLTVFCGTGRSERSERR